MNVRHTKHQGIPISFSKTLPELLARKKDVTRRAWTDRRAKTFIHYYDSNYLVKGYDKSPHRGGRHICDLKLIKAPYKEALCDMPLEHLKREGAMVNTINEFIDRYFNGESDRVVWVIEFEIVEVF